MNKRIVVGVSALTGLAVVNCAPALGSIAPLGTKLRPYLAGLGRRGHVALTFDDGPDPRSTRHFLDVLGEMNCRATFFLLGSMVRAAPELTTTIVDGGHEVAVHGDEHRSSLWRMPGRLRADIGDAVTSIMTTAGQRPTFFRPPYGTLSAAAWYAARQHGLRTVLWTSWGRDWRAEATVESIVADVHRGMLDGGTILLHDSDCTSAPGSWRTTLAALPMLIDDLRSRGLVVGPLRDHWKGSVFSGS
jgi:peptidoglycan/xylan/chitin deacetylase (PgdA/CDA1 family)